MTASPEGALPAHSVLTFSVCLLQSSYLLPVWRRAPAVEVKKKSLASLPSIPPPPPLQSVFFPILQTVSVGKSPCGFKVVYREVCLHGSLLG